MQEVKATLPFVGMIADQRVDRVTGLNRRKIEINEMKTFGVWREDPDDEDAERRSSHSG